jgi:hypothetical protein
MYVHGRKGRVATLTMPNNAEMFEHEMSKSNHMAIFSICIERERVSVVVT